MKRNLLMAGLVLLALASCKKEEQEGGNDGNGGGQSSNTVEATINLTDAQGWSADDAVGVYTADDINVKFSLVEGAGTTEGKFKGSITKETTLLAAYIPYVEDAEDMQAVPVNIPAVVPQEGLQLARFQVATVGESLSFSDKLTTLKVTFSNVEGTTYEGKALSSVTVTSSRKITGGFTADVTSPSTSLAGHYTATSSVELTFPSGTTLTKDVVGYASVASYIKGGDKLNVSIIVDGKSLSADITVSESSAEGQEYEIVVDAGLFEPKMELVWAYGAFSGEQELLRPQGNVPAVDNSGNVYVTTNGFNKVLKIKNDGTKGWVVDAAFSGTCQFSPSVEADGSVVYVGGGGNSNPFVRALNAADGSTKWTFDATKFFNGADTPAPNLSRRIIPAITDKAVYIGNGGAQGTVIAIDKATGTRLSYVSNADGSAAVHGGCNVGVAISKGGYAAWHHSWGSNGVKVSAMETPTQHVNFGGYAPYCVDYAQSSNNQNGQGDANSDAIACLSSGGSDYMVYMRACQKKPSTKTEYANKMELVCVKLFDNGTAPAAGTLTFTKVFDGAKKQDQGGIVIGPNNEIIVSMKHNDTYPGGVYAFDLQGNELWKYTVGADVGGAAAVDNNGYVHVMSDDGWYHIVQPASGAAKLIYKENMMTVLKSKGGYSDAPKVGSWSSPMIGNDGKIYAYIPVYGADGTNDSRYGVVMCMQYAPCTGPGNTAWPMKGADARHSGNQK